MRRPIRIGVRTRLLLAAVGVVAAALVIGVTAFNLVLDQRLSDSATSLAKERAAAEIASLSIAHGEVVSRDGLEERDGVGGPVWVFSGRKAVERPRAPAALNALASSLAGGPERTIRVNESVRLYALPVLDGGKQVGTVVAGLSLDPYDETATIAFVGSLGLAVVLLAAVALLSHWILGKALLPVSRMTGDAEAWSDYDLDRRFDPGEPYDELTRLAATLDRLLERLSASLRHEQRLTAELSHELRTPLARIFAETELALRRRRSNDEYRQSLEGVHRNAEQMTRAVEALLAAARHEVGATRVTSDARLGLRATVEALREEAETAGIEVTLVLPDEPVRVAIEEDIVERIVHPLVDNALRYGSSQVSVELGVSGTSAYVEVADDGAGLDADETEAVFEPGSRGSAAAAAPRGAGLGLALARRLARAAGGDVEARASAAGGSFGVRLPLA